jgi:hypothetical protein
VTSSASIAPYVEVRAGLGDLPAKLRAQPCKIAYFGASPTVQRRGYRPSLHERICDATGQAHEMVTAGISGSGSITGAFMVDELVLRHRPDLCFVDFVSRDAAATRTPDWVGPAAEGIVLKLLAADCRPCFLYMYRRDHDRGVHADVVAAWEAVADHYGIPSIDLSSHVRDGVASGSIELDAIIRDVVHTTQEGGDFLADAIAPEVLSMSPAAVARPRARLHDAPFSDARVVPAHEVRVRDPERCERLRFRFFYDYVAIPEGNGCEWPGDSELVGMLLVLGPETSGVRVTSPSGVQDVTVRDAESFYDRIATSIFATPYPAGTRVTIEPVALPHARLEDGVPLKLNLVGFLVR